MGKIASEEICGHANSTAKREEKVGGINMESMASAGNH